MAEVVAPVNRLDAEGDPTKNHDERHGFGPTSLWRNAETGELFICGDASPNAARWFLVAPKGFAAVARSGKYEDLSGRPRFGPAAFKDVGKGRDAVASGNDDRIEGALQKDQNLSDLPDKAEAARALGLSSYFLTLAGSEDKAAFLRELGFEYLLDEAALRERFQPKSARLSQLAETKAGIIDRLMELKDGRALLDTLGLLPGKHVQSWHETLDRLKSASEDGVAVVTASNKAAIVGFLEVDPGKDVMPSREAREELRQMRMRIDDLERRLGEPGKAKA